jgi:hypothetical protein
MTCRRLEDDDLLAELGDTLDPHVEQCADCREHLRGYQQIARWLAEARTANALPADWKRRTLARVHATPLRRRRRIFLASAAGVSVAAAAAVALLVIGRGPSPESQTRPELALRIDDAPGWRASMQPPDPSASSARPRFVAHPGQVVQAEAIPADARYFEIRVYRSARDLLLRCPEAGAPACVARAASPAGSQGHPDLDGELRSRLVWKIPSIGTYQVVFLVSQQPIAGPGGSLDDDVAAASAAGARAIDVETIHVH